MIIAVQKKCSVFIITKESSFSNAFTDYMVKRIFFKKR